MPSLETAKRISSVKYNGAKTIGQIYKEESDWLMEETWDDDVQSKICYIYDYFHDDQPALKDHITYKNTTKTRIDAKFIVSNYGSITKDQVAYHLMFKPSQPIEFLESDELYYFETNYRNQWGVNFPTGLYCDIPNEKNVYEKWLILTMEQGNQFIKYNILPCNYLFEWIEVDSQNRYKRRMWGCDRQQLSYDSGMWIDRYFNVPSNISKAYLPLNLITENINYIGENGKNQRMIISAKTKNPLVWKVTKLENTKPLGIIQLTFSQDPFNTNTDYIEKDSSGKIIGMWADYYDSNIEPIDPTLPDTPSLSPIYGKIISSNSTIKVGGSYKTLTLKLYDKTDNEITNDYSDANFEWSCFVKDKEENIILTDKVTWLKGTSFNQKKIKFPDDRNYLGELLHIKCLVTNKIETIETTEQFELVI